MAIHASELRGTRWIPWVPAVLLLALTTACSIPLLRDPFNPPLRIGVAPNYPPVIFEQEGRILGIEADLAGLLSRDLGRPVEFVALPFPKLLDALAERKVDMLMGGLSVTHERSERIRFVSPYMEVGQLALIRSRDIARFGRIRGLRRGGTRVGYERGTSGERYVASSLPQAESFGFDDVEAGLRSLRADRIDYFIHDAPTVWRIAGDLEHRDLHGLYRPLTREELAWAVHPRDTVLHAQLEEILERWRHEGLIEPIVQRWIPVRVTLR